MNPILIRVDNESAFSTYTPVGAPCGDSTEPIAQTRTAGHQSITAQGSGAGVWECTPGRFRRQVPQAEYSYFISGEGSFTPDGGVPIDFYAGDSIYFAPDTQGEWHIKNTVRKAYLIIT